jgi:pimeloyl-ACP methyl ester carboxylesterase
VIVHGLSYFSYDWIQPASELSEDRLIAAMDMRGFGDSGWSEDYSVPAFSSDIIALLDHLKWTRAILIGHSMGGRNCTYCAAENPGRIAGLLLVDWAPENAPSGSKRVMETVLGMPETFASIDEAMKYFKIDPDSEQGRLKRPRFEAYLKPVSGGFTIKRDPYFRNQFRRIQETGERPRLGMDLWQLLSRVACPMAILRGLRSDMFTPDMIPKVKAANPRIRLVELDTGHDVAGGDPGGFVHEARTFFNELGG